MDDTPVSESQPDQKNDSKNADPTADQPSITHQEAPANQSWLKWNWSSAKSKEGDTAMAVFNDPNELDEPIDPAEERKLIWKIDLMILPYLAVCYAFFYIDKVCRCFTMK